MEQNYGSFPRRLDRISQPVVREECTDDGLGVLAGEVIWWRKVTAHIHWGLGKGSFVELLSLIPIYPPQWKCPAIRVIRAGYTKFWESLDTCGWSFINRSPRASLLWCGGQCELSISLPGWERGTGGEERQDSDFLRHNRMNQHQENRRGNTWRPQGSHGQERSSHDRQGHCWRWRRRSQGDSTGSPRLSVETETDSFSGWVVTRGRKE